MGLVANLSIVFIAGLITALATGLGAFPFFIVEEFSDRWNVVLWGIASGIMLSASVFGLLNEGLKETSGVPIILSMGVIAGILLVVVSNKILSSIDISSDSQENHQHNHHTDGDHDHDHHIDPTVIAKGDFRQLILILGILTVHSFPEGVAIGVSFAEMGLEGGVPIGIATIPVLAIFMTIAISIHNIPEGLAISIPLKSMEISRWRMVGAAIFSSLPQPLGAVIAFVFVRWAKAFLPFGFGFAAGAMIYLVFSEFIPEALETGDKLGSKGYTELIVGLIAGFMVMVPLIFF
ncbi:MAG: ZIP family metal transporter [Halobacteriaceae archaeon]